MPDERLRALVWAGEYLRERRADPLLSNEAKQEIRTILRHYPEPRELRDFARLYPDHFATESEK